MGPTEIGVAAGKWLWDTLGKEWTKSLGASAKRHWERLKWQEKESAYLDRLMRMYGTTTVLGNPKEIQLSRIYTDVFVLESVSKRRRVRNSADSQRLLDEIIGRRRPREARQKLINVVKAKSRVFVLGKPGAGKSTFLRSIVWNCHSGTLAATPVFVPVRHWHDTRLPLLDYIAREFEICGFPDPALFIRSLLTTDKLVVLFDGLDEVSGKDDSRANVIRQVVDFARAYNAPKIVVTCRTAATDYSFEGFTYAEIADFTSEQQRAFIQNWYRGTVIESSEVLAELNQEQNQGLRDLARTPLLLAMLCLVYDETMSFPRRRVELYQEATNALLKKWDATRGIRRNDMYGCITNVRREQLLSKLAMSTFLAGKVLIDAPVARAIVVEFLLALPEAAQVDEVEPDVVLATMEAQHGLFVERASDVFSFSHLTLHEYFAAKYLADHRNDGLLKELAREHVADDRWKEVFLLLTSLLDDAEPLFVAFEGAFRTLFFNDAAFLEFLESFSDVRLLPFTEPPSSELNPECRMALSQLQPPAKLPTLAKAYDLAQTLAVQFHRFRGADSALWRVRKLVHHLHGSMAEGSRDELPSGAALTTQLVRYLSAANVLLECVQVAALSDRGRYVDRLVIPRAFGA